MTESEAFVQVVSTTARVFYFDVCSDPAYALPRATPQGAEIFADCIVKCVSARGVISCANNAASACDIQPVHPKSVLQEKLAAALQDFYLLWRPDHPRKDDMARAFAEAIVAAITQWIEREAFNTAARKERMTQSELQEEAAQENEAEYERNRPKPPRKKLYPI